MMDFLDLLKEVFGRMFRFIGRTVKAIVVGLFHWVIGIFKGLYGLWCALGPKWLRISFLVLGVGVGLYFMAKAFLTPNLTHENIYQVRYLNDGWDDKQRQTYYYTPQGTELLGLEYDWFVSLELPLSHEPFASEENMRGWGFIMAPGQRPSDMNPGNLPVGFTRHTDPHNGKQKLDLGCAMCHTGELHYKGTALRVDGGQAMQSLPTAKKGEFITTLGASVIETLFNPAKWDRFATKVVGDDQGARDQLREDFKAFAGNLKRFVQGAGKPSLYPVEEGRGRTDAVGRIGNVVFGFDLDEPDNYKVADAPASYPYIWDMWRLDWVQYTGFTNQAMARNVGESLGVLAPIKLIGEDGNVLTGSEFGETIVDIDGMHCVEGVLRELKPPKWPEDILGHVDIQAATRGKSLFADQCQFCHGPHLSKPYDWAVATKADQKVAGQLATNYKWDMAGDVSDVDGEDVRKDWRETIWAVPWLATDVIGTDPKLADNYMDNRYDPSKLVPGAEPVNAGDGLQLLLNTLIPILYERWGIEQSEVAAYDGLNIPFRIENQRAYKSKPLHGVWATPPFLHNGSVPTIYDLLSPMRMRPKTFFAGNREYDPDKLGYVTYQTAGSFRHDTTIAGNHNTGHLFTDEDVPGRIGHLFSEREKLDLIEYIKVLGNPDFDQALGGDPQNWSLYSQPPVDNVLTQACQRSHDLHANVSVNPREESK